MHSSALSSSSTTTFFGDRLNEEVLSAVFKAEHLRNGGNPLPSLFTISYAQSLVMKSGGVWLGRKASGIRRNFGVDGTLAFLRGGVCATLPTEVSSL